MKSNAFLSRNRRVLILCAMSVALHGALLELAARRTPGPPAGMAAPAPLALRLMDGAPGARSSAPATQRMPERQAARPAQRPAAPASNPVPPPMPRHPAHAAPAAPSANPAAEAAQPSPSAGEHALLQMPGRYRVRLPPSTRLSYEVLPQGSPAASRRAYLDWRKDGGNYSLEFDGVLGRLSSQGAGGDAGIVPALASETLADHTARTSFDPDTGEIRFEPSGTGAPGNIGMQDRASVLVQLAAIGRGLSGQLEGEIRIVVAGTAAVSIEQYRVLGQEDVETGIGTLPAWHLAQAAAPGQARLELWLAPSQDWLPVQLRLSAADGTVSTQVLNGVERPAPPP